MWQSLNQQLLKFYKAQTNLKARKGMILERLNPQSGTHHPVCSIPLVPFQHRDSGQRGKYTLISCVVHQIFPSLLAPQTLLSSLQQKMLAGPCTTKKLLFTVLSENHTEVQRFERLRFQCVCFKYTSPAAWDENKGFILTILFAPQCLGIFA